MFNNNPCSFNANYSNFLPTSVGYRIYPVGKIKEVDSFYPDLQGNPLFFYDQSENCIYVKQRNIKTLEIQTLKYKLDESSIKAIESENTIVDKVEDLKAENERLKALLKEKKVKEEDV